MYLSALKDYRANGKLNEREGSQMFFGMDVILY